MKSKSSTGATAGNISTDIAVLRGQNTENSRSTLATTGKKNSQSTKMGLRKDKETRKNSHSSKNNSKNNTKNVSPTEKKSKTSLDNSLQLSGSAPSPQANAKHVDEKGKHSETKKNILIYDIECEEGNMSPLASKFADVNKKKHEIENSGDNNRRNSNICTEPNGDSSSESLLVENDSMQINGIRRTSSFLDRFKYEKDSSSSESSTHDHIELNDDSEDMVLRLSESEENINFPSSPSPTINVATLLGRTTHETDDLSKSSSNVSFSAEDQDQVPEDCPILKPATQQIKNGSCTGMENLSQTIETKSPILSTPTIELHTDKISKQSDDNFEDLISAIVSKDIEITKKKNDGITVSDLEDFLNDVHSENEVSEKTLKKSEVCIQKTNGNSKDDCCSIVKIKNKSNEKASCSHNAENIYEIQSSDTVIKTSNNNTTDIKSSVDVRISTETSESTVDNDLCNKNNDRTLHDDHEMLVAKDSKTKNDCASIQTNFLLKENDVTFVCDKIIKKHVIVSFEECNAAAIEKGCECKEMDMQSKEGKVNVETNDDTNIIKNEIQQVEQIESDTTTPSENNENSTLSESESYLLTNSDIKNEKSYSIEPTSDQTVITNDVESELQSKDTAFKSDSSDIQGLVCEKLENCQVVTDIKSDGIRDEGGTEGIKNRKSRKRSRDKRDEELDLNKQKILKNDSDCLIKLNPELFEEDIDSSTVIENDQTAKRTLETPENDTNTKKPRLDETDSNRDSAKNSGLLYLNNFKDFMDAKKITRMTRETLEEFTVQKMCETFNKHCKLASVTRELQIKEIAFQSLRNKYNMLKKQVSDLEIVQTKITTEMRKAQNVKDVAPVKITRSVGLQVSLHPLKTKTFLAAPVPHSLEPPTPPLTAPLKKKSQRASAANRASIPVPPPLPALTPAPSHISRPPPVPTGKGIKTILPKVYSSSEVKESSGSLLGSILQKPTTSISTSPSSSVRKTASDNGKVIDLTDEDDNNRASSSASTSTGNIRVVAPHQLTNGTQQETITPIVTTNMPRLTYLVQTPGQQGQPVLLATTNAPTRPGQARPTLMFKPVVPQGAQRLNLVRPAGHVPGTVAVLPQNLGAPIGSGMCKYVTTSYNPGTLTRSPALTTRAIAPAPRHPAPLPGPPTVQPSQPSWKMMPPRPSLKITLVGDGIVLSWRILNKDMSQYEEIASYQLYAYQETSAAPSTDMWRKVGDVKALALPMACTLTQFTDGNKYHFAVRGVDVKSRVGPFSTPEQITLPAHQ